MMCKVTLNGKNKQMTAYSFQAHVSELQAKWTFKSLVETARKSLDAIILAGFEDAERDYKDELESILDAITIWKNLLADQETDGTSNEILFNQFQSLMKEKMEEFSYMKAHIYNGVYRGYDLALGHVEDPELFGFVRPAE